MTMRNWAFGKLRESGFDVTARRVDSIEVARDRMPSVTATFVEPGRDLFRVEDLLTILDRPLSPDAVVITRRAVEYGVVEAAAERGVLLESFGGLVRALQEEADLTDYQHRDERYLRQRIGRHYAVTDVTRIGLKAWRVTRGRLLEPLNIVTHDRYEFTDDELLGLLDDYRDYGIDAFVVTNPNAQGFGSRVIRTAQGAGVVLCILDEFIDRLAESWT